MSETLTIVDNRTGKKYELPIADGAIRATDLRQIKADQEDVGLVTYDPAFMNTAACRSRITYIDGDKGVLEYRFCLEIASLPSPGLGGPVRPAGDSIFRRHRRMMADVERRDHEDDVFGDVGRVVANALEMP